MKIDLTPWKKKCGCGKEHQIQTDIILEEGGLGCLPELIRRKGYRDYRQVVVIADQNTYDACGRRVCGLTGADSLVLDAKGLHADETAVQRVLDRLDRANLLIAAGAGTIHDITRFVAKEIGAAFISVPSAASVDGFVSAVAAMTWHGFKKTFPAVSPIAVIADTVIFSKAPYRLTASGVSDLLGKYTALADWEISNIITGEYFCPEICALEYQALETVVPVLGRLRKGERQAYEKLMYGLLLSGLAMQMTGNSRPASGCEHHMSHFWEMGVLHQEVGAYHGEKVSAGLMECAKVYHQLRQSIERGGVRAAEYTGWPEERIKAVFGALYSQIAEENTPDPLADVAPEKLEASLPQIARVLGRIPEPARLEKLLKEAGSVTTMEQIGLPGELLDQSLAFSPYVRSRLTLMRLKKMLALDEV